MPDRRRPSRRVVLGALVAFPAAAVAAGAIGVEGGVLPGRARMRRALGIGEVDVAAPAAHAPEPVYRSFDSTARGRRVTWGLALPAGAAGRAAGDLPVVLALHGRGGDARSAFTELSAHEFLARHVERGGRPLALVSVDGGSTYWHPRASGDDPLAMITGELLPRVSQLGLATDRFGVWGWSMGGFGALLLARQAARGSLGAPGRLVAAAASSPALFADAAATAPGAFDSPADFARWGDLAADPAAAGVALRVSCGVDDPFCAQVRRYRAAAHPTPAGGISDGRHDAGYWRSQLPAQLAFMAGELTRQAHH